MTKDAQLRILKACGRFIAKRLEPVELRLKAIETKAAEIDAPHNMRIVNAFDPKAVGDYMMGDGADVVLNVMKKAQKPPEVDEIFSERVSKAVGYTVLVMAK